MAKKVAKEGKNEMDYDPVIDDDIESTVDEMQSYVSTAAWNCNLKI